jgi:MoaA/NifB/PqqE/SkfB family radical SAM enzyme
MDAHRWRNISKARNAYLSNLLVIDAYPIEAFFEVAARCNLRCQMCAINFDVRYRGRGERPPFFTPELFARLKPIFPTLHRGFLFGLGEPTLNPHLIEFVDELSRNGAEVCFNTNATLMTQQRADEIAKAGAARVTVSIDGASAGTYESIRHGAAFEQVVAGIRALVSARERFGNPEVDLSFVAMASNIHELPALLELASSWGASAVHVEPLLGQVGSTELDEHYERENLGTVDPSEVAAHLRDAAAIALDRRVLLASRLFSAKEYEYMSEVSRQSEAAFSCSEPWASIWVTSSGEVRTCCINDTSFGNLYQASFEEIWNGNRFRAFRAQHAKQQVATGCANCVRNGRVRSSTFFRPTQAVTYKPYFVAVPKPAIDDPVSLSAPAAGATSIGTILVAGALAPGAHASMFELMLGYTPVANLGEATFSNNTQFRMRLNLPYLTEGAHVMWVRKAGDSSAGWSYRDFFFWRPGASTHPQGGDHTQAMNGREHR